MTRLDLKLDLKNGKKMKKTNHFVGDGFTQTIKESYKAYLATDKELGEGDVVGTDIESLEKEKTVINVSGESDRTLYHYTGNFDVTASQVWALNKKKYIYLVEVEKGTRVIQGINTDLAEKVKILSLYATN